MTLKLIDCPACENKVSPLATACPRCGHPISESKSTIVQKEVSSSADILLPNGYPISENPASAQATASTSLKLIPKKEIRWSPMGSKETQGPDSTYAINNIPLSQEAILQRIRHAFTQSGFSVEQSEYLEGTAYTVGGLIGTANGGLVGGMTNINKKTWNPFLVSKAGHRFMRAKVTVLATGQKSRMMQGGLSRTENDIELHVKIEEPNVPIWVMFSGAIIGILIGVMCNSANYGSNGGAYLYGFIGAVLGAVPYFVISHMAWNATEVMNFQKQLTDAMLKIEPKFKS